MTSNDFSGDFARLFGVTALALVGGGILLSVGNCALYWEAETSGELQKLAKQSAQRWMKGTGVRGTATCSSHFAPKSNRIPCTISDENQKLMFLECDASLFTKPEAQSCNLSRYEIREK